MICFGEVGRRIVGKPVEAVIRSHRSTSSLPNDIMQITFSKFTFTVTITDTSFRNEKKSYQVKSVITAYGKQHPISNHPLDQSTSAIRPNYTKCYSSNQPTNIQSPSKTLPFNQMSLLTPPANPNTPENRLKSVPAE